ncbi:baseplate J/gp47 family protein [Actinoplanes sp. LDG1-06]|uniref:Baseplate J/gp47 family protein n=1 Tax=Paractinoplanes ovalisporus TaxID=2810368 RepID=A0ABS2A2D3_9ACTN|nr:baseplate J/gp47 family protein [Actinoplanes ovalisporus]MBM2613998.1 baseplate J/gp47 family protein [Actinoplanes ovalisporus]
MSADRGRIVPPDLDDRTWQDLVDEMRALIPAYAPQWTDHNPSDLGITLIELFAWLGETVIYRLNRTPEKTYLAFLELLGITRDPATPAYAPLTFAAGAGKVVVPAGTEARTAAAEAEEPIVFETDEDVTVLPVNLRDSLLIAADTKYGPVSASPYEISLNGKVTAQICLGFDRATAERIDLRVRLGRPAADVKVTWVGSAAATDPLAWPEIPGVADGTGGLTHDGVARLTLPATWGAQRPDAWTTPKPRTGPAGTDPAFWVGIRLTGTTDAARTVGVDRILFNSASAHHARTIRTPEVLGVSTGGRFQIFPLAHRPLYRIPASDEPYGHLVVDVGTGTPPVWETWTRADDLPAGPGKVYRADPVTGEILFGDHDERTGQGHGSIPVAGAQVRAARYRYVAGGADGNVGPQRLTDVGTTPSGDLPAGITAVTNLGAARDGSDEEALEDALRRAPLQLKTRNRAITAEDYEFLAKEATTDVRVARALPPRLLDAAVGPFKAGDPWPYAGLTRSPGSVFVVVVPDQGDTVDRPVPPPELLREVQEYLDQRRDLSAQLRVVGPLYLPVVVETQIFVWDAAFKAGVELKAVETETRRRIKQFLHPTRGGPAGTGWEVGQPVLVSDLFRALMPADDVGTIARLQIRADVPAYHPGDPSTFAWQNERPFPLSPPGASVRLADYELACAAADGAHDVTAVVPPM